MARTSPEWVLEWARRGGAPRFGTLEELDRWLKESPRPGFIAYLNEEVLKETFHPNLNVLYRVPAVYSFEPLLPARHLALVKAVNEGRVGYERGEFLRRLWAVSVVIEAAEERPGFVYLGMVEPGMRAVLADRVTAVQDKKEARGVLLETDVDVLRRVVLEGKEAEAAVRHLGESALEEPREGYTAPGRARVVSDSGDEMTVEVEAERAAILFVADSWYPDFRATVDGVRAPVWRANYAYRAVPVEAGRHTVEFVYRPAAFYMGVVVTIAGIAVLALAWVFRGRRGVRQG